LCEPECPVDAIRAEDDVPEHQNEFIRLNAELSVHPSWTQITVKKPALAQHEQWTGVKGKLAQLDRNGA
jgi:ferredoxin